MSKYLLPVAVFAVTYGCSNSAQAYDWTNIYGASLTLGFDDNYRLDTVNEIDTSSTNLGVFTRLEGSSEISRLGLSLSVNNQSFSDSSIDEQTGYQLALNSSRTGERLDSFLDISLDSVSTANSELLDTGILVDGTRELAAFAPGVSYRLNERDSISANLILQDVSYDTVSLTDYTDNSLTLSWRHGLDETSSFAVSLSTSVYETETDITTDTNSLNLGYELSVSAQTTYDFSIGYSEVDRPTESLSTGIYGIEMNYRSDDRNNFLASVSSGYEASGFGEVREEDRLSVRWNHGLSERSQLTFSADGVSSDARDYYSIEAGSNYQYSREINLAASYRFRQQSDVLGDADSSTLLFSLSYSSL